jgi:hypothetical protein
MGTSEESSVEVVIRRKREEINKLKDEINSLSESCPHTTRVDWTPGYGFCIVCEKEFDES